MVALTDLQKVTLLASEQKTIASALAQLDGDGRILGMTIGVAQPAGASVLPLGGVQVSTARMSYPQAMVDTIKQFLRQRQDEIGQELQQLGVTGVGP